MVRIEWDTETTGTPACLATRSAVRWRVPVSTVGMGGSGLRGTVAPRMRPGAGAGLHRWDGRVGHQVHVGPEDAAGRLVQDQGAVHLGQLGQALGGERDVDLEPAGEPGLTGRWGSGDYK